MRSTGFVFFVLILVTACNKPTEETSTVSSSSLPIGGTWQLISGTLIEKGDTTFTDYTKDLSMIKILNGSHFAFMSHDLKQGKDSTATFSAGGGRYTLNGNQYTEYLEYCNAREWEGHTFQFTVTIENDTLTQRGVEKIATLGVERLNIEKYSRIKKQ
jgi:hypothetical protein